MKRWIFSVLTLALAGCAASEPQATTSAPPKLAQTKPTQAAKLSPQAELAKFCRVCVIDKGEKIEEFFPSRLDTKRGGKTYKFCMDDCKKKFDASPQRYALK